MCEVRQFDESPAWNRDFADRSELRQHLFAGGAVPVTEQESQDMEQWIALYVAQHRNRRTRVLRRPEVREAVRSRLAEQHGDLSVKFGGALTTVILIYYVISILILWRQLRRSK